MKNRFYTVMIVPERSSKIFRIVLPRFVISGAFWGLLFLGFLGGIMLSHYGKVLAQIAENKSLKEANLKLQDQAQHFETRLREIEETLSRVKSFAIRMRGILNLDSYAPALQQGEGSFSSPTGVGHSSLFFKDDLKNGSEAMKSDQNLEAIQKKAGELESYLEQNIALFFERKDFLSAVPTLQPAQGYLSSGFGVRVSPLSQRIKMHEGVDIATHKGSIVMAAARGKVTFASDKAGYGLTLIINHGYGLQTLYGHLDKITVALGDTVSRASPVGLVGNSGRSTAPHLHYEIRVKGNPVDPLPYLMDR